MAKKGILERLKQGPVLGDGGYLLELEKRGWVRPGPFTPEVAIVYPNALRELHIEFREAGAEVLQALTFYASRDKLATVGLEDRVEDINRSAVRVAKEVAGDQCLVAGNLSLTWMYEHGSASATDRVRETFDEQLRIQCDEGVDFIIGETFSWLGEALLAVERAKKTGLPVMVTICFENKDETAEGKSAAEAAKTLLDAGADIVGMNCLRSPEHTLPSMETMRKAVDGYLACQPVGYRTPKDKPDFTSLEEFPYGLDPLQLTRKEMGEYALRAKEIGINYIGSCCGSVSEHVREMARVLGKLPAESRIWKKGGAKPMSAYEYYDHDQMTAK
ncbi:MAG TPA: homocysteine S-methyltransferase family protein [Terriglobales bacterium]|jgi:betaine-homocysteine S-methyltransferase|nr:homocysteine S-methyltransferase family protein [Terriglobales bacterium]